MFDILNEVQYIKDVLSNGFGDKWITDAGIYVRYCKLEGYKKKETKEKLQEKFEKYVPGYTPEKFYKKTDEILNRYWKKTEPFREINEVKISREILDWFFENKDLTMKEKKILFTFYCWSDLQKQAGIEYYQYINLRNYMKRFREEANVTSGGNIKRKEITHLIRLGYLKITFRNASYNCIFLDTEPFNSIGSSKDLLHIKGEYLHSFGRYLEDYIKSKREKINKDKECEKGNLKKINCIDCGKEIYISLLNSKACRCKECQAKETKRYQAEWTRKKRSKNKMSI